MKIAISLLTLFIGYSYANSCTGTNTCDSTVTQCASGYTLTCLETAALDWHCVCVSAHDKHACQVTDDCHNQHLHHCLKGHWACTNNHCHCTGGNHHGGAVGK